ncbi:cerebellin-3-like isoform X2 [Alosa pseudoharengus]|uniref:cerebellin-3-like isoform X2 n=1 Tax=Alosa pseudoharengus TaxID=34774 RepID=UPI003F8A5D55
MTPGTVPLLLWSALVVAAAESGGEREIRALMEEQMRALMEEQMRALMEEQRGMRALMEEQRVELRHTKAQLDTMETRLRASEKLVQQLRSDIAGNLNLMGSQMEELRRKREERRVAFSASLITSGHVSVGPANTNLTLIYRNVITNIGDAYNNKTGIFTAPVRGVYYFTMFIYGSGHNWVSVGASLSKNKEHVVIAYCHLPHGKTSASNGASLLLEVGDQVFVILYTDSWVRDSYNHHTSFSGHLLFPM